MCLIFRTSQAVRKYFNSKIAAIYGNYYIHHSHITSIYVNESNVPIFPVVVGSDEQAPERSEGTPSLVVGLGGRGQWVEPGT